MAPAIVECEKTAVGYVASGQSDWVALPDGYELYIHGKENGCAWEYYTGSARLRSGETKAPNVEQFDFGYQIRAV